MAGRAHGSEKLPRARRCLVAQFCVVACAASLWGCAMAPAGKANGPVPRGLKPLTFEERTYSLEFVGKTLAQFGGSGSSDVTQYVSRFKGCLVYDLDMGGEHAIVKFEPGTLEISLEGQSLEDQVRTVKSEMNHPVMVDMADGGRVTGFRAGNGISEPTKRFERSLLAICQYSLPSSAPWPKNWKATEEDPIGKYTARYALSGKRFAAREVSKTIAAYAPDPDKP